MPSFAISCLTTAGQHTRTLGFRQDGTSGSRVCENDDVSDGREGPKRAPDGPSLRFVLRQTSDGELEILQRNFEPLFVNIGFEKDALGNDGGLRIVSRSASARG